ncbi:hypothetical protein vBCbaSRXM_83 [Citromicrobium phage vB_CbaS-RXM]|nr:hypothetical protein vBCbaSRXM_83 [Citromicrobium phage vB_CbaS-RXM]
MISAAALGATVREATPPVAGVTAAMAGTGWFPSIGVLLAGIVGLIFGAMWRVSFLRETRKSSWAEIKDDLVNSCFTAGANGVLTVAAIRYFEGDALTALVIGVCVGGTGVRALLWMQKQVFQSMNQTAPTINTYTPPLPGPMDDLLDEDGNHVTDE